MQGLVGINLDEVRMRSVFLILTTVGILLASSGRASAYTKDEAMMLGEQTFAQAARNLYTFTEQCNFFGAECGRTAEEFSVLRGVFMEMSKYGDIDIRFGSEQGSPGSFLIDGQVRIAKTTSVPGDPISINRDLIVEPGALGFLPIALSQAVAVLVHEMAHHYAVLAWELGLNLPLETIYNHEQLDILGSKVGAFLEGRLQRSYIGGEVHPLLDHDSEISFENYISEGGSGAGDYNYGSTSLTFVRGPFGYIEITEDLAKLSRCPSFAIDDDTPVIGSPFNLYFESFQKKFAVLEGDKIHLQIEIPGTAFMNCLLGNTYNTFDGYKNGVIDIYFKIVGDQVTFEKNDMSLSIEIPKDTHMYSNTYTGTSKY